jgi:hypothetical protein
MDVMIVDNFLQFPIQVREWALNQTYMNAQEFKEKYKEHTDWPGLRTEGIFDLDPQYANIVFSAVAGIIQRNATISDLSMRSYFQFTREQDGYSWIHQDNNVKYAAILYLNPNTDPKHGTTLYRCNDVNRWESLMSDQKGYQTMKQINETENKKLYDELFTPIDVIGNVFNRLAIYKGDIYHKSSSYFGDDIRNGRLTQVFFINGE